MIATASSSSVPPGAEACPSTAAAALRRLRSPRSARLAVRGRTLIAERVRHGMTVKPDSLVVVAYTLRYEDDPDLVCAIQYVIPEDEEGSR